METITSQPKDKMQSLQVLRAVAALLVLWCHLKYNLGISPSNWAMTIPVLATDWGGIGVDIFFVISGFVIAMTASNLKKDWQGFLIRRIARIVPLYFAISTFVLLWNAASGVVHHDFSTRLSFKQIFNTYLFLPILDVGTFTNPLSVNGWTLCFEMWFYLCFTSLMKLFGGPRAGKILPPFLFAGVLLTTACYHGEWFLPKFLFHPMTLEFCAGCILFHTRNILAKGKAYMLWMLILLGALLGYESSHFQFLGDHWKTINNLHLSWCRTGVWGGFAFCLVGAMIQIDLLYKFEWPILFLLLGDASYSIYLIFPIIMWPITAYNHFLEYIHMPGLLVPPPLCAGIYIFGTMTCGILLWKYFELPTTVKIRKYLDKYMLKARKFLNQPSLDLGKKIN